MLNPTTDGVQFRFTPVNSTNKSLLSPWHISDPNIDYYKLAKGTNSDYKPSDGWEVFKVNLGRLNDDVTMRLTPTLVPYMMFYNRYTGILRVFGYLDRTSDYHQMVITLSYDKPNGTNGLNYSALLSLNDNVHQPLDSKTSVDEIKAITNYANNQYLFFWADFPLAYDPCVCLYKSNLSVRFKAVQTATINLTGRIIGNVVPVATPPTDFQKAVKFVSSAINIGKSIYTGNYADFASSVSTVIGGFTNLNPGIKEGMDNFLNVLQLGLTINNISNTNPQTKSDKPLSEKEKTEKTIAAVSTYFSALAKSGSSNTMALTASAILNGTSLTEYDFGNSLVRFSTPGSKDSHLNPQENYNNTTDAFGNVRPEYVAYNEILGTFALLKKPVINISYQRTSDESCGCDPNNRFYVTKDRIRFRFPQTYTENGVTKNNPILYAFNPIMHPNLNNTKIKVALVFKEKMGSTCSPGATGVYNNEPLVNFTPLTATYPNITETITPVSYDEGYSIDHYVHSWAPGADNADNTCDTYEFVSPLVPLNFVYDLNGQMTLFSSFWEPYGTTAPADYYATRIDEVLLKVYIDFESTDIGSNGQPNKSTMVFTYPVQINEVSEFPINGVIDFTQYRSAINPVTASQINQFCTGQFENTTYHAKELLATTTNKEAEVENNSLKEIPGVQLSARPNPSKGAVNLIYTLTKETNVVISVYNMNMQKVATDISLGKKSKGVYQQSLQLGNLSSGVYLVRLKTDEQINSTKLIIAK